MVQIVTTMNGGQIMLLLSVESENGATLTYRLHKTRIAVGSAPTNDVVVGGPGVADRHLVIQRSGETFTFTTAERQTVVLNGERRSRGVLNPGDRLRLGTVTLVFRGVVGSEVSLVEEKPATVPPPAPAPSAESLLVRPEPGGYTQARIRLFELFSQTRPDRAHQLVATLHEAVREAEFALVIPREGGGPAVEGVVLASHWSGELPVVAPAILRELAVPGRYVVQNGSKDGGTAFVAVRTPTGPLVALLLARPVGALGDEGVALLAEAARLLGLFREQVERTDASFSNWELEARHRLEMLLPGTSQAVQVLRDGLLQAARSPEPVLICGAEGSGRTETARILATLGPVAGRRVVILGVKDTPLEHLRQELFGPSGKPTFTGAMGGKVGEARGGMLVVRNAERLPEPIQMELVGVVRMERQQALSSSTVRWVITCGEDPLALVQQGKLSSALFMAFSTRMLRVPRLEERREDLPLIIASLLHRVAEEQGKSVRGITLECLNALLARTFPGQLAELVGELRRLVAATADGDMVRCDAQAVKGTSQSSATEGAEILLSDNLKEVVPRVEQLVIDRVMQKVRGNQSKGARILGISRGALIAKLKEYGIPDYRYLRRRRPA
ncbi:MAG: sigma 54-interacting transcriptional regulator [Thermoanaerobaculum sp.]|nr:sigma 54-interacting transcriptional regulator [Thermoanaerobaculum sp.]